MFEAIIIIIACAFTLYGLYRMSYAMKCNLERTRLCERRDDEKSGGLKSRSQFCLIVKDCDYNVEWLVRSFYRANVDASVTHPGLTVVDCGSEDDTKKIVEMMKNRYEDLRIMSAEEFITEHEWVVSEKLNLKTEEFETDHKTESIVLEE